MERYLAEEGMIVRAKAGRDAGRYYAVIATDGAELMLADGRRRTLAHPKRKNPAHVQATKQRLALGSLTDKALRAYLKPLNEAVSEPQTKMNQIRKEVIDDVETGCN